MGNCMGKVTVYNPEGRLSGLGAVVQVQEAPESSWVDVGSVEKTNQRLLPEVSANLSKIVRHDSKLTNLIYKKPCTASAVMSRHLHRDDSSRMTIYGPDKAVDGNESTCFAGGFDGKQHCWIACNLGERCVVTKWRLKIQRAKMVAIQHKVDGVWVGNQSKVSKDSWCEGEVFLVGTEFRVLMVGEVEDTAENYNLLNCGMEIYGWEMLGYHIPPITYIHKEPSIAFISYNWTHQNLACRLAHHLEETLGIRIWQDVGQLTGGDDLIAEIYKGIANVSVVIQCLSVPYSKSVNCGKEVFFCTKLGIPVITVLVDPEFVFPPTNWMRGPLSTHTPVDLSTNEKYYSPNGISKVIKLVAGVLKNRELNEFAHPLSDVDGITSSRFPQEVYVNIDDIKRRAKASLPEIVLSTGPVPLPSPVHRNFALHRPCWSSGCFYSSPNEWITLATHCVTNGTEGSRWSGARDANGACWIAVDLGCDVDVDKIRINFEGAYALQWHVERLVPETSKSVNGVLEGTWEEVGNFRGSPGWVDTPALSFKTRQVKIVCDRPYFSGGGFSCWDIEVYGSASAKPLYEYFVTSTAANLSMDNYPIVKILDDVQAAMKKKCYVHSDGPVLGNYYPRGPEEDYDFAIKNCEAVLMLLNSESASSEIVKVDIEAALKYKKPILALRLKGSVPLSWPPPEPISSVFLDKLYIDFSEPAQFGNSLGLLLDALNGKSKS